MPGRTDSRRRLLLVLIVFGVAAAASVIRLGYWQIGQRDRLVAQARQQLLVRQEVPQVRAAIYDRSGTVVLANTVKHDRLVAAPGRLTPERRAAVAAELVSILGLEGTEQDSLVEGMVSSREYVILARGIEQGVAERIRSGIRDGRLSGVSLEPEQVRVYPQAGGTAGSSLAAHLLGFVNRDGKGQYGVEQYYDETLAGTPRVVLAPRDITNRAILESGEVLEPGSPGTDIRLTIDAGLQLKVEQEVFAAWVADSAKSVSAVVMDPVTGEILAEATYPSYDANAYTETATADPGRFKDPVVSAVYEPGSVFKMLAAATALTRHVVSEKTKINDSGTMRLDRGRTRIADSDAKPMGRITFEDVIAYSRNVGIARVAFELGRNLRESSAILFSTWRSFGFGRRTGVDLAGEVPGLVNDPGVQAWREIDLANGSFGQGVAVTLMQLATAYSAMVNGGILVTPHVVKAIGSADVDRPAKGRVIEPAIARRLVGLMQHVLTRVPLYRSKTLVPGYLVGGKTGTAQAWDPKTRTFAYDIYNFSFIGFIGRQSPELVVAVTIQEGRPRILGRGNLVLPVASYELFRRIATDAVSSLDLAPVASPSPSSVAP